MTTTFKTRTESHLTRILGERWWETRNGEKGYILGHPLRPRKPSKYHLKQKAKTAKRIDKLYNVIKDGGEWSIEDLHKMFPDFSKMTIYNLLNRLQEYKLIQSETRFKEFKFMREVKVWKII